MGMFYMYFVGGLLTEVYLQVSAKLVAYVQTRTLGATKKGRDADIYRYYTSLFKIITFFSTVQWSFCLFLFPYASISTFYQCFTTNARQQITML